MASSAWKKSLYKPNYYSQSFSGPRFASSYSSSQLFTDQRDAKTGGIEMQEAARIMDSAAQLRVLVAAANPMQLKILKGVLERAGHRVVSSTTSDGALDEIESKAGGFDMIVVDEDLPGLGGLDVIRVLRYLDADAHTPAIIRCNEIGEETKVSCIAAGADDCLPNPVDPEVLLEAVSKLTQSEDTVDGKQLDVV